jgi:hypothetical protein
MDNNSCILFENYMVYYFKTMLYCCMLLRKLVVFVVNNLMYLLYLLYLYDTFICEFMKLV